MYEYASITQNMIEYAGIHLEKQGAEYARILNMADVVHSIRSPYKFLSGYSDIYLFRLSNI